jgi:cellulose 1,4-beta-cellobiosidase
MSKRQLALRGMLAAIVVFVAATSLRQFSAQAQTPACTVDYVIRDDWGNGMTTDVTIHNNSATAINGWTLTWTFPGNQQITNLWNGTYTQSGASVSVRNVSYNSTIVRTGARSILGSTRTIVGRTPSRPTLL